MSMQQMRVVQIAPMPQSNMTQNVMESPSKFYVPMQGMTNYNMLQMQPVQVSQPQIPARGNKRSNPDSTQAPKSKKRATKAVSESNRYQKPLTPAVARRNERERNRVKQVNMGFETLREHVPVAARNKKISKVDTLRAAVEYINQLQQMLEDTDQMTTMLGEGNWTVLDSAKALMSLDCNPQTNVITSPSPSTQSLPSPGGYSTDGSVSVVDSVTSPVSSTSSVTSVCHELQFEDELIDFTSWFQ